MKELLSNISLRINTTRNPDLNIIESTGEVMLHDEKNDGFQIIGKLKFTIINSYLLSESGLLDAFDSDGDMLVLYSHLKNYLIDGNTDIEGLIFGSLLSLNDISISNQYRNKGVGKLILSELIKWSEIMGIGCIVLLALAYEEGSIEDKLKSAKRLQNLYESLGFETLAVDDNNPAYIMYYDLTLLR